MDTSKYIKKCPRCGKDIEPSRCTTTGTKILSGAVATTLSVAGFCAGGPLAAAAVFAGTYAVMNESIKATENHDYMEVLFHFKCECGKEWKEKIQIHDEPNENCGLEM